MTILKLALLTSLFFVCIALVFQAILLMIAHFRAGVLFHASRFGWTVFFGIIWYVSFAGAYSVLERSVHGRMFSH
jgi:hypothetical protein